MTGLTLNLKLVEITILFWVCSVFTNCSFPNVFLLLVCILLKKNCKTSALEFNIQERETVYLVIAGSIMSFQVIFNSNFNLFLFIFRPIPRTKAKDEPWRSWQSKKQSKLRLWGLGLVHKSKSVSSSNFNSMFLSVISPAHALELKLLIGQDETGSISY